MFWGRNPFWTVYRGKSNRPSQYTKYLWCIKWTFISHQKFPHLMHKYCILFFIKLNDTDRHFTCICHVVHSDNVMLQSNSIQNILVFLQLSILSQRSHSYGSRKLTVYQTTQYLSSLELLSVTLGEWSISFNWCYKELPSQK